MLKNATMITIQQFVQENSDVQLIRGEYTYLGHPILGKIMSKDIQGLMEEFRDFSRMNGIQGQFKDSKKFKDLISQLCEL